MANRMIAKWNGSTWSNLGPTLNGRVNALVVFDDGTGPALYAGGNFTATGDNAVPLSHVARWDGTNWSALGAGVGNGDVHAFGVYDDGNGPALYVGGTFTTAGGQVANRIAKWDGSTWSALGDGIQTPGGVVRAIGAFADDSGNALFVGGSFDSAGGVLVSDAAKWNGTSWSTLRGHGTNDAVEVLSVVQVGTETSLYAGGEFTAASSQSANHVAKWENGAWVPLSDGGGNGVNATVFALTGFDDGSGAALIAGGDFTLAGGAAAGRIAQWDGTSWSSLGTGTSDTVRALATFDDGGGAMLFAGGDFLDAGGVVANHVAQWDGLNWSAVGGGVNDVVNVLRVFDFGGTTALYAGGYFTMAGGNAVNHIAKWDGVAWTALGTGIDYPVADLELFDDGNGAYLYASYGIERQTLLGIMRWDGISWSNIPAGEPDSAVAMEVFDDGSGPSLFAGGSFFTAGGVSASYIAKFDGTNWFPLRDGLNYAVDTLASFDDGSGPALFVGGSFYIAWDMMSNNVAQWRGSPASCPGG
jgi:hypothetical protein